MYFKLACLLILQAIIINSIEAQQWESPCPRLFTYEPQKEDDRWYGVVTLISDSDLNGVWLRIILDRPSLQLGNWFGEIRTSDNIEYLVHNRNHELKANMPYALRFYIKYNKGETPPKLVGIRLNAKPVCPDGGTTTAKPITGGQPLITSGPAAPAGGNGNSGGGAASTTPLPPPRPTQPAALSGTFTRPGIGWPGQATTEDDDVFQGDFQLLNRPQLRPTLEPECGTVVRDVERRRRDAGYNRGGWQDHQVNYNEHGREQRQYYYNQQSNRWAPAQWDRPANSHGGKTPNFPQVSYHIGQGQIPNFLNQHYSILDQLAFAIPEPEPEPVPEPRPTPRSTTTRIDFLTIPEIPKTREETPGKREIASERPKSGTSENNTVSANANMIPYDGMDPAIDLELQEIFHTPMNPEQNMPPEFHLLQEQVTLDPGTGNENELAPIEQQPRPLITHGQSTKEGEFPWHAALYHERGADLQYICGASLISQQFVITVAHCVTRRRSATTLNPESLVVYLGKYYLKKWSNPGIQDTQVQNIIVHPQYNSQTYANDLALLKLQSPVTFTDYVRPICLWGDTDNLDNILSTPGTVVGWGFDHTGKVTEELTQAKMPVVTKETCIYSFPDFFSRFTTSKTYCAGFRNGTSVCNGDSGGGMIFPKTTSVPGREIWQLRGLVSISVALQNQFKCDSSHYVVFTDIAKYLDWITNVMKQ